MVSVPAPTLRGAGAGADAVPEGTRNHRTGWRLAMCVRMDARNRGSSPVLLTRAALC